MAKSEYTDIAVVVKAHGLKGDMVVKLGSSHIFALKDFKSLFLKVQGAFIPYILESSAELNHGKAKIKLATITNSAQAEIWRGQSVYQLTSLLGVDQQLDYNGFTIIDDLGNEIGEVIDIIENPAQSLLVIERAGQEIFIPLVDDFVVEIDEQKKVMKMSLPEGLLDL